MGYLIEPGLIYKTVVIQEADFQGCGTTPVLLLQGKPGPQGPPGSNGFVQVFVATTLKSVENVANITTPSSQMTIVKWDIPQFQDTDYELVDQSKIVLRNKDNTQEKRYQISVTLTFQTSDEKPINSYYQLTQDGTIIPGSKRYFTVHIKESVSTQAIIQVEQTHASTITVEYPSTLILNNEDHNQIMITKLG